MRLIAFCFFPILAFGQVHFQVKLDYDNAQCVTGNNCTADVFRAQCTSATTCPVFSTSPGSFAQLTLTTTQTVGASNTHFTSIDTGAAPNPLANSAFYAYAVRNTYVAYPSNPGPALQTIVSTPSGIHGAVLNWSNTSCRTSAPCAIQVYRATCTGPSSCPSYPSGTWKALSMATGLVPTVGTQGTTWQYSDNDSALVGSTTYSWVATCIYNGAATASPASQPFTGTTAVGRSSQEEK